MKTSRILLLALVVFLTALMAGSLVRIGPDEVGVKTRNFTFGLAPRGIVEQDFGPGWHLNLPIVHRWNVFPSRTRRVELTRNARYRSELGDDVLMVHSSDGDVVMLDVHIFFRIRPGSAHLLLQDSGPGDEYVRVMNSMVKDRLRAIYGTLNTEQFYDALARSERTQMAKDRVIDALAERHIDVVDILIQDVAFEQEYESKIKEKKLADQNVELNKAQARASEMRHQVTQVRTERDRQVRLIETSSQADVAKIRAEAMKYAAQQRAQADLYRDQLRAKGDLALAQAQAVVKREKTQALVGSGGANLTALEAIKNLKVESIAFPTAGRDWFDVRNMATRLGARP